MLATDKFKLGDRVYSSPRAYEAGLFEERKTGTVVGYSRCKNFVRVLIDGRKSACSGYATCFWIVDVD